MIAHLDVAPTRLSFRPAAPSDAPIIARLHNARSVHAWRPETVLCRLRRGRLDHPILVAEGMDGRVRACLALLPDPDEDYAAVANLDVELESGHDLALRCLLVLWRQAEALGYRTLTLDQAVGWDGLAWRATSVGQRLELTEAAAALRRAELHVREEDALHEPLAAEETLVPGPSLWP